VGPSARLPSSLQGRLLPWPPSGVGLVHRAALVVWLPSAQRPAALAWAAEVPLLRGPPWLLPASARQAVGLRSLLQKLASEPFGLQLLQAVLVWVLRAASQPSLAAAAQASPLGRAALASAVQASLLGLPAALAAQASVLLVLAPLPAAQAWQPVQVAAQTSALLVLAPLLAAQASPPVQLVAQASVLLAPAPVVEQASVPGQAALELVALASVLQVSASAPAALVAAPALAALALAAQASAPQV